MHKVISYIFPVYRNEPSLRPLYDQVRKNMQKIARKYDYEFVFVNDGSPDNSISVLMELAKEDQRVKVVNLSRNFGHQAAVTAGLDRVSGDAVIIMDADLQDPPAVCLELIQKWEEGFDVVYAQRRTRKDTFFKRLSANLYYRILASSSSIKIPRNTGDFRLVDRKVVDVVKQMKEYNRFLRGMFSFVGFRQAAVQFDRHARFAGKSEYTMKKMLKLGKDGLFGFSDVPLKFVSRLGFIVSLLSVIGILYAIMLKVFWPHIAVPGWTMIVVSIFFMGGVQLVLLGVIGEYIGRIYDEVRRRPTYIVAEEINFKK
jgi:glycosyltransferase involved in cell wall biosynthesis